MDDLLYVTTKLLAAELARRSDVRAFSEIRINDGDIERYVDIAKKIIKKVNNSQ